MHEPFDAPRSSPVRRRRPLAAILLISAVAAVGCANPVVPFQLSIVPDAQVFPKDWRVWGVAVNGLYGVQREVKGLDIGPFNDTTESLMGLSAGVANIGRGDVYGLHLGVGNSVDGGYMGSQVGFVNHVGGALHGFQIGLGNVAGEGAGLQLGVVNQTSSMKGLQIGLLNFNSKGWLPFFPFFNFGF
ncbi:MAG: LA_2272 family surface repeat-containing protein [Myxococcota bacterium]